MFGSRCAVQCCSPAEQALLTACCILWACSGFLLAPNCSLQLPLVKQKPIGQLVESSSAKHIHWGFGVRLVFEDRRIYVQIKTIILKCLWNRKKLLTYYCWFSFHLMHSEKRKSAKALEGYTRLGR